MEKLKVLDKSNPGLIVLTEDDGFVKCLCISNNKITFSKKDISNTGSVEWKECLLDAVISNPQISNSKYINIVLEIEPSRNLGILGFIRNLKIILHPFIGIDTIIYPSYITELPRKNENFDTFLTHYLDIKNNDYDGEADLVFYIGSVDKKYREKRGLLSIEEILQICEKINYVKGSKISLTFGICDSKLNCRDVCKLFDKEKFSITLFILDEFLKGVLDELANELRSDGFEVLINKEYLISDYTEKLKYNERKEGI